MQLSSYYNTKGHYMKESNTLVANVTINQVEREILPNTKEQYMKESNIPAGNVANNFLTREVLSNTRNLYIKVNKLQTHLATICG